MSLLVLFNQPAAVIGASSATTDGQDVSAAGVVVSGAVSSATTDQNDTTAAAAGSAASVSSAQTAGQDATAASAGTLIGASSASTDGADATAALAEAAPVAGMQTDGFGFQLHIARTVHRLSLVQRILAERASRQKLASYPSRKPAKKIEQQAAELALDDGSQSQFDALLTRWKAITPPVAAMPDHAAGALFMAHVAERIRQLQQEREQQDEEEAVLALLLI